MTDTRTATSPRPVVLFNRGRIPHYRVPVYSRLAQYLGALGMPLTVVAEGVQAGNPHPLEFDCVTAGFDYRSLVQVVDRVGAAALIFWTNPRMSVFALCIRARRRGQKVLHWGHRRDQQVRMPWFKHLVYDLEHLMDDAIIVYSPRLREQLPSVFRRRTFVANNTIDFAQYRRPRLDRAAVRAKYGITRSLVIVCLGRMQRRKRIEDLVAAFHRLAMPDVALVLAGPDEDGVLRDVGAPGIHVLGPVYGDDSLDLLSASDVYCLPGAIGLSIVDAFYCGLPVVTEAVRHGPEIMYLRDGENGFVVPVGDVDSLADRLRTLLEDPELRSRFSAAARHEILTRGHVDRLCEGFAAALEHAFGTATHAGRT